MLWGWVAFDSSKFFSVIISYKVTILNEYGKAASEGTCLFFLFLVYLGGFQVFLLHLTPDHGEE